jgi:hypothetical protein
LKRVSASAGALFVSQSTPNEIDSSHVEEGRATSQGFL